MWFEDQYRAMEAANKAAEDSRIARNLLDKYGLDFADMQLLYLDDDTPGRPSRWMTSVPPDGMTATNDGCRHYLHAPTGYHFAMDYHFADNEWFKLQRLFLDPSDGRWQERTEAAAGPPNTILGKLHKNVVKLWSLVFRGGRS